MGRILMWIILNFMWNGAFCQTAVQMQATFKPETLEIEMKSTEVVSVELQYFQNCQIGDEIYIDSENTHVSSIDFLGYELTEHDIDSLITLQFNVTGKLLGRTKIKITTSNEKCLGPKEEFEVVVTRRERLIDNIFVYVVGVFSSILYINFGCAVNLDVVKDLMKKPIGPIIGFCTQFIVMPLIAFCSGLVLFPNEVEMRLGMFLVGISPGGGASNMWTYVLGGNIHLSITMTTISTFASFGMMPLWLFTLGQVIFKSGNLTIPYLRVILIALCLIVPLFIGLLIKRFLPRIAKIMIGTLKWLTPLLLLVILTLGIISNAHVFKLFSWKILIAGMCIPWFGYLSGYLAAFIMRQPLKDCLTIAIETGIQHIGIAIFLISFSLPKQEADLTIVIPGAVGFLAPFPLLFMFIYKLIAKRFCKKEEKSRVNPEDAEIEPDTTEQILENGENVAR